MTTGALIFAFNAEQIDYLAMAAWSARNIHRHLNIPVCVITNEQSIPSDYEFDQVIQTTVRPPSRRHFQDIGDTIFWYNANRIDAYMSPWDQTLVLDADYVVASDQLKIVLEAKQNFLAHRWAYDVTSQQPFNDLNWFGKHKMPMWWATVMMFRRSVEAELIFDSMKMVHDNWLHYRYLYRNPRATYRNDHALSIALGLVNGHTTNHAGIPWGLATLTPSHELIQVAEDHYRISFQNSINQRRYVEIHNQDFHAMGKGHLGELIANSI